jgi:hypothetical protein
MPVYYNSGTAQYEAAQATSGKEVCVGIIVAKASSTVGNILLVGSGDVNITSSLQTGDTLSAGRYYLSETQAGKLTKTVPYHSTGAPAIQVSVLVADGTGKVYVLPYEFKQGLQGPAGGPQGPQGPQGPGVYNGWEYYRQVGNATVGSERWYRAGATLGQTLTSFAPSTGLMYAVPFFSPRGGTVDRLAINVLTTAAAGGTTARLGIYSTSSFIDPYPTARVVDGGTIAVDTTGVKNVTISITLDANKLYWFVLLIDAAGPTTVQGHTGASSGGVFGLANTLATAEGYALSHTQAYGALPSTFPTSAPTIINVGTGSPLIACRYSA